MTVVFDEQHLEAMKSFLTNNI